MRLGAGTRQHSGPRAAGEETRAEVSRVPGPAAFSVA